MAAYGVNTGAWLRCHENQLAPALPPPSPATWHHMVGPPQYAQTVNPLFSPHIPPYQYSCMVRMDNFSGARGGGASGQQSRNCDYNKTKNVDRERLWGYKRPGSGRGRDRSYGHRWVRRHSRSRTRSRTKSRSRRRNRSRSRRTPSVRRSRSRTRNRSRTRSRSEKSMSGSKSSNWSSRGGSRRRTLSDRYYQNRTEENSRSGSRSRNDKTRVKQRIESRSRDLGRKSESRRRNCRKERVGSRHSSSGERGAKYSGKSRSYSRKSRSCSRRKSYSRESRSYSRESQSSSGVQGSRSRSKSSFTRKSRSRSRSALSVKGSEGDKGGSGRGPSTRATTIQLSSGPGSPVPTRSLTRRHRPSASTCRSPSTRSKLRKMFQRYSRGSGLSSSSPRGRRHSSNYTTSRRGSYSRSPSRSPPSPKRKVLRAGEPLAVDVYEPSYAKTDVKSWQVDSPSQSPGFYRELMLEKLQRDDTQTPSYLSSPTGKPSPKRSLSVNPRCHQDKYSRYSTSPASSRTRSRSYSARNKNWKSSRSRSGSGGRRKSGQRSISSGRYNTRNSHSYNLRSRAERR